jgi:ATP-dependent Clp protease ATP-binding subunit ClpC
VFERFGDQARRVAVLAREEAGRLRHDVVGTEHILLGLIRGEDTVAAAVCRRLGVSLQRVKDDVERVLASVKKTVTFGEMDLTPAARRAFVRASEEASLLGHPRVAPTHLLLALLQQDETDASRILTSSGLDVERTRREFVTVITFLEGG